MGLTVADGVSPLSGEVAERRSTQTYSGSSSCADGADAGLSADTGLDARLGLGESESEEVPLASTNSSSPSDVMATEMRCGDATTVSVTSLSFWGSSSHSSSGVASSATSTSPFVLFASFASKKVNVMFGTSSATGGGGGEALVGRDAGGGEDASWIFSPPTCCDMVLPLAAFTSALRTRSAMDLAGKRGRECGGSAASGDPSRLRLWLRLPRGDRIDPFHQ